MLVELIAEINYLRVLTLPFCSLERVTGVNLTLSLESGELFNVVLLPMNMTRFSGYIGNLKHINS